MSKIRQFLFIVIWQVLITSAMAHPVSVMMGNAVWAGDRLIINMEITLENVMLHYHIKADTDGWLSGDELMARTKDFLDFVRENFIVTAPDTIFPSVILTGGMPFSGRMKYEFLRNHKIQFEVKFICHGAEKLKLLHTMGERSKGLQSTALINFYLKDNPQFVPLFSDVPVIVDLVAGQVTEKKFRPVLVINGRIVQIRLPSEWVAHGIPFELRTGQAQLIEPDSLVMSNKHNFSSFSYEIPEGVNTLELKWQIFNWQMRRIELKVKEGDHEEMMIISRFQPACVIDLKKVASLGMEVAD